jgi:hypothetical protein
LGRNLIILGDENNDFLFYIAGKSRIRKNTTMACILTAPCKFYRIFYLKMVGECNRLHFFVIFRSKLL